MAVYLHHQPHVSGSAHVSSCFATSRTYQRTSLASVCSSNNSDKSGVFSGTISDDFHKSKGLSGQLCHLCENSDSFFSLFDTDLRSASLPALHNFILLYSFFFY